MMTDEQAVKYASKLKRFCREQSQCSNCVFERDVYCAVNNLPQDWVADQLITPLTSWDKRPLPSPTINPKDTLMNTDVIQEVLRVKQQYPNMDFYRFICFAASRVGHCEDDHQLLLGIQMLDKTVTQDEREMNR